jgi:hypothetical protein
MKTLQTIGLLLLLSTFSSAYAGWCINDKGVKGIVIHDDGVVCDPNPDSYYAHAQYGLGEMYLYGAPQMHHYQWQAGVWFEEAAKQGHAKAQTNLGLMYDKGKGFAQDYKEAVKWYRLAAEQGNAQARTNLGVMYVKGQGVPKDNKEAVKWTRLAAEQGDAQAQTNLGVMLNNGQGVIQDSKEAVKWYRLAYAKARYAAYRIEFWIKWRYNRIKRRYF